MIYKNSTELMQLAGYPVYMSDIADACLLGRLNLFMIGDTGSGKTQLARDMMDKFGDKTVYILGRNDMDTRELFQQINLEKLKTAKTSAELKDRMHVIIDSDYFSPKPSDTLEILAENTNPRVNFQSDGLDQSEEIINKHNELVKQSTPFEKLVLANYLVHGLDYCNNGMSKRKLKDQWPAAITSHAKGSDEALVLPLSTRAAKSTIRLSQALDSIVQGKAGKPVDINLLESMMQAYKFVAAYSGVLNDASVDANYSGDKYKTLDAVIQTTQAQVQQQEDNIRAGLEMVKSRKVNQKILDRFTGRWTFMRDILTYLAQQEGAKNEN